MHVPRIRRMSLLIIANGRFGLILAHFHVVTLCTITTVHRLYPPILSRPVIFNIVELRITLLRNCPRGERRRTRVPAVIYSLSPSTHVGFLHNDYISGAL